MTDFVIVNQPTAQAGLPPGLKTLQLRVLWLLVASSAIVFIEPSPFEFLMLVAAVVFIATGLRMPPALLVPLSLLVLINVGYSISAINRLQETKIQLWVLTSWYLAVAALFFAMVMLEDTKTRLETISRAYVFGAVLACLAGIVGYLDLIPAATDLLTISGRARGTFKDPNVLGAFLIYPTLYTLHRVIEAPSLMSTIRQIAVLGILVLGIFLAFSRGAWGILLLGAAITIALLYITAPSHRKRMRIVGLSVLATLLALAAIGILLSFESTSSLFMERASLSQPYDGGKFGRFGRQVIGAEMALDYPLGVGPLEFGRRYKEATHNSFLNAFVSGGWLSGLFYPVLIFTTIIYGFRSLFRPSPWQSIYIVLYTTVVMTFLESFIIDTDHWRHYFMLIGMIWGIAIVSREGSKPDHA